MIGHPFTGIVAGEVGVLWTTDLAITATLFGAAALLIACAWAFVTFRTRSMRKAHIGAPTRLSQTATLNRVAAAITAITLAEIVTSALAIHAASLGACILVAAPATHPEAMPHNPTVSRQPT